ncbi:neutral zinc metallopeptidase [Campylobacter sp. RM9344]|uniref:Neutral zinc metallopeptidase n=1 Tax=Campylobacter californiensis TaxID=1032243 RepID=A0AAW3ZQG5_9BACT|nr:MULTISPECIES: neutral zinc metallopeptidase [unclassified Campylobacter]MBE2984440.1 neutral zinc metallopeptidase [Campylobacter sp. RM6883]MBE2995030.1 neutral zinc metallopeptidase [Campylobacter sp. RM6913]MBE3028879.1 neutral zinc metallopeptidase [Campylobacter sp. RM9344]MBE3607237.1 neutral zinc metallopeptidase [Campylobacter sp. RM9337]QCD50210.1 putative neutral zinc metallopeptidase [Campylobacter sp. RM6914]
MKWQDSRQSSNVEDRRSNSQVSSAGSFGALVSIIRFLMGSKIGRIVLVIGVVAYFMGYDPLALIDQGAATTQSKAIDDPKEKENFAFVSAVLAETEDVWANIFKEYKASYVEPNLVLFKGQVSSGCGFASSQVGPFYCPADQKVYLDLSFFDELEKTHKAGGDFARAYVIAHEIGHHVQNLVGTLNKIQSQKSGVSQVEQNALQVKVELQADCYAGIWAHYMNKYQILDDGDIEEALNAASAIGDDTLQKKHQGHVVPDSFTHGSSKQRMEWFKKGFEGGKLASCSF